MNINLAQPKNKEIKIENRFDRYFNTEPELAFIPELIEQLPELKLYLIGGIVRDTLIKHPIPGTEKHTIKSKDFDFVACGVEIDELIKALKKFGKVDLVGKNFGVLKVYPFDIEIDEAIDIALPRTEIAGGSGGYKDVETQSDPNLSVENDLSRRDLTINAIAYDINNQTIIDPFDGQKDLEKGLIKSVGNPEERFGEDYSRMLRAIRFACRFNFEIDKKTWQAIAKLIPHINDLNSETDERIVARETISKELLKSFGSNPAKALELLDKSGALNELIPEIEQLKGCKQPKIFHSEGDVFEHTKMMIENFDSPKFKKQFPNTQITPETIFGVLLHDIGKPASQTFEGERISFKNHDTTGTEIANEIINRLKFTTKQKQKIIFMIKNHMFLTSNPDIYQVSNKKIAEKLIDSPHSQDLLMLLYLDKQASLRPDGSLPMQNFYDALKKIEEIKEIRKNQPATINDMINGKQIAKILEIKSGPLIGITKTVLAELKDSGKINSNKEATTFLEKNNSIFMQYSETSPKDDKSAIIEQILQKIKI